MVPRRSRCRTAHPACPRAGPDRSRGPDRLRPDGRCRVRARAADQWVRRRLRSAPGVRGRGRRERARRVRLPVRQLGLGLRLCCGADGGLPGAGLGPAGGVVRRHRPCHRAGRRRRPGPRCAGHGPRQLDGGGGPALRWARLLGPAAGGVSAAPAVPRLPGAERRPPGGGADPAQGAAHAPGRHRRPAGAHLREGSTRRRARRAADAGEQQGAARHHPGRGLLGDRDDRVRVSSSRSGWPRSWATRSRPAP